MVRIRLLAAIGIDMNPATAVDVIAHCDQGSLPFAESSFDEVRAIHLIEHVGDIVKTMEEFYRITRPSGIIYIVTPHYTDFTIQRTVGT